MWSSNKHSKPQTLVTVKRTVKMVHLVTQSDSNKYSKNMAADYSVSCGHVTRLSTLF